MTTFQAYPLLALVGAGGGLVSGAVGLAGGIFIVPALVALFGTEAMGDAIVVSFFAVLFNSLSATLENRKSRGAAAYWQLVKGARLYAGAAAVAALAVAAFFGRRPDAVAKPLLAALQLLLAVCMLIPRSWYEHLRAARSRVKDAVVGAIVGGASTLIGVGGGTYTMFYFLVHGRQIKDCTLTSNFVGIFIGLMGIAGYYGCALLSAGGGPGGTHLIDTPGRALLIGFGIAASPVGVRLQARLPAGTIRTMVVLVLAASSGYVLLGAG
ncbi:sulfite exporter TauE/SafE family protein [Piscinibacter sp. XHJ-5]|uniref:sulfite exporter TauE/SafE family protein n=1 Tax=Piscinibacter sp. XHJ-5 TaxID=3037797 RepID=UPI002452E0F0|nr:sulfite exporter TauE/SafE family protein [Piscinibacter sp. XHJ-5]